MKRIVIFSLLLVASLLCVPLTGIIAQDALDAWFVADDGSFWINYPAAWETNVDENTGLVTLNQADATISFFGPGYVSIVMPTLEEQELGNVLTGFLDILSFATGEPTEIELGSRTASRVTIRMTDREGMALSVPFAAGGVGIVMMNVPEGMLDDVEPTLLAIAQSFDTPQEVKCTVSTDNPYAAVVRVGPGTNRTELFSLPVGKEFPVIGKGVANDDTLWWRLDKDATAPQSAASELWVAQENVTPTGNCNLVEDVDAPPIVPIIRATPVPEDGAEPVEDTALVPNSGRWYMSANNLKLTCGGVTMTTDETIPSTAIYLTVEGDGSAIVDESGMRYARTQPGIYTGRSDVSVEGEAFTALITIQVTSPDRMNGTLTFFFEGCNGSAAVLFTR